MPMEPLVSQRTLERCPERAYKFLRAAGTDTAIRDLLASAGYTQADHEEGWGLTMKVANYAPNVPPPASTMDPVVRDALVELDRWDEPNFRRLKSALERLHPAQAAFVFEGLTAGEGAAAVASVATFLSRVDALESGSGRAGHEEGDRAAMATLVKRGIDRAERDRLAALVRAAQGAPVRAVALTQSDKDAERLSTLRALHAWLSDWSDTARAVINRRDYLIRLGLAKRKATEGEEDEEA